jgi:chemotaxis protein methyltransferase CheR
MSPPLSRDELALWSRYIYEICGISLDASKGYLIEARLGSLAREQRVGGLAELYARARTNPNDLRQKIIDAITTNETSFFRDGAPFDLLQHKLVPELIDRRRGAGLGSRVPIRVWSAACSTGQEAYTTAIVLKELLGDLGRYDIRILGTDISDRAVAQASYGCYGKLELERGLAPDRIARHFTAAGDRWKIRDEIRALATFRKMNLLEPFSFPAPFDIVFCRNVAIYFTESDKIRLFQNIGRWLAPDGALIIGATESLAGLCPELEPQRYLRTVFYQRKGAACAR